MNKEEIFNILYNKEKWEVWYKFQNIEKSIEKSDYLYAYFDEIKDMLLDNRSYIRLRGFRIICKLAKWDQENKIDNIIDILLGVLDEDKSTIVRKCLEVLNNLVLYKPELSNTVGNKLRNINLSKYKDSMSALIKEDIDNILKYM